MIQPIKEYQGINVIYLDEPENRKYFKVYAPSTFSNSRLKIPAGGHHMEFINGERLYAIIHTKTNEIHQVFAWSSRPNNKLNQGLNLQCTIRKEMKNWLGGRESMFKGGNVTFEQMALEGGEMLDKLKFYYDLGFKFDGELVELMKSQLRLKLLA